LNPFTYSAYFFTKERGSGKRFQKSSSPLSLHLHGRRSCTVSFKTAPCSFFFFKEKKRKKNNLRVTQKWVMTMTVKKNIRIKLRKINEIERNKIYLPDNLSSSSFKLNM